VTDISEESRNKLFLLGYLGPEDWDDDANPAIDAAVVVFQENHGELFTGAVEGYHGRAAAFDGGWGDVSEKLLWMPRDCSCPDIARDGNGNEIAEARWPEHCALELEFSNSFSRAPGLTEEQTQQGIAFAIAEWNVAFESPLNGELYPEYLQEWQRLAEFDEPADQFVLWVGTLKHEIGHALGFNHTPGDPESVLYPSMRGQWLLNRTDLANMRGRGYSKTKPIKLKPVEWSGENGTHIWAELGRLGGSTLAWSMLASGSCSQRAEQRYASNRTWNQTKINIPPMTPPPDPDLPPAVTATVRFGDRSVDLVEKGRGDDNGGGNDNPWW
jgi:hypothetical protein